MAAGSVLVVGGTKGLGRELAQSYTDDGRDVIVTGRDPARAAAFRDLVLPAMVSVREQSDLLETLVADDLWPLPKYREILFLH